MKIETGKKFKIEIDGLGTVMDYVEDRFIFVIKDAFWNDIELQMARKGLLEIDFVYRYDVAVFLLTLGDIDTSDFYFNIQENDDREKLLASKQPLQCTIVLLDENNMVCFRRDATFNQDDSAKIIEKLQLQQQTHFHEGEFDVNVQGLMSAMEPFERQHYALVKALMAA